MKRIALLSVLGFMAFQAKAMAAEFIIVPHQTGNVNIIQVRGGGHGGGHSSHSLGHSEGHVSESHGGYEHNEGVGHGANNTHWWSFGSHSAAASSAGHHSSQNNQNQECSKEDKEKGDCDKYDI